MGRRIATGIVVSVLVALLIGIPTGIVHTSWYTRMTPVLWWNYPVWVISSGLTGALAATYVRGPGTSDAEGAGTGKTFFGNILSLFAVGCPICNKLVVMTLGVSGALTWFAPVQPFLAVASVGLLAYALRARRRTMVACLVSGTTRETAPVVPSGPSAD